MALENEPILTAMIESFGRAADRLTALGACEGAAGNLSAFFRTAESVEYLFPEQQRIELPVSAPALAGGACLVTCSGVRLGDVSRNPAGSLALIWIHEGGNTGRLCKAAGNQYVRVTSEFNSHLAVHQARALKQPIHCHAVVHVQPKHATFLSHIPQYQDTLYLNKQLLRWQPEMILQFPEGIGVLPFYPPGSEALMKASAEALEITKLIVWGKHGVLARSDESIEEATDLVEYVESAARYEVMNLATGNQASGLSSAELRSIGKAYGVEGKMLDLF